MARRTAGSGHLTTVVGPHGRVVIPAAARKRLGLVKGSRLLVEISGQELRLRNADEILAAVQARFAKIPKSVKLSDTLIAERRQEALRDEVP